jgi:hypothetical protein
MARKTDSIMVPEEIEARIYLVRGQKIMLDRDLAQLYQVETRVLNQAVRRNINRFPCDFMLQLTGKEFENLMSQIVISSLSGDNTAWGGIRKLPFAFTEQGVAMLSSVLKTATAIRVNIQIIRVFTRMRQMIITQKDILLKLEKMERKLTGHDQDLKLIFQYLKHLLHPPEQPRRRIGFKT